MRRKIAHLNRKTDPDKARPQADSKLDPLAMVGKMATGRINPRELQMIAASLKTVGQLKQHLGQSGHDLLIQTGDRLHPCRQLLEKLVQSLLPDPPIQPGKGEVIAEGVDQELDEIRNLLFNGKAAIKAIQEQESERTGIPSLKVKHNKVFGYYLEVTLHKMNDFLLRLLKIIVEYGELVFSLCFGYLDLLGRVFQPSFYHVF